MVTRSEILQEKKELIRQLKAWCGPIPQTGPLATKEIWRREYESHTEIKLSYEAEAGDRIPAYLLIPRHPARATLPGVFAAHQCGFHCDLGKEQVVGKCKDLPDYQYSVEDQAYGLELVLEGFVVLAPDTNKIGERFDPSLREQWHTVNAIGAEQKLCCQAPGGPWGKIRWKPVLDVMRGIDLLCECPLVDSDRIGMIGHSMGSDTLLWSMPFDERIAAGVISGGSLVGLSGPPPHGLPYEDLLTVIAPRPFCDIVGDLDYINLCDSNTIGQSREAVLEPRRKIHERASAKYSALNGPGKIELHIFPGEHSFPAPYRQKAYAFLKKWLF